MFWNDVRTVIDGMEKSFEREYAKFDEYGDVEGLSEFKELVVGLRDSGILIELISLLIMLLMIVILMMILINLF